MNNAIKKTEGGFEVVPCKECKSSLACQHAEHCFKMDEQPLVKIDPIKEQMAATLYKTKERLLYFGRSTNEIDAVLSIYEQEKKG